MRIYVIQKVSRRCARCHLFRRCGKLDKYLDMGVTLFFFSFHSFGNFNTVFPIHKPNLQRTPSIQFSLIWWKISCDYTETKWNILFGSRQIHFLTMLDKHRRRNHQFNFSLVAYEQTSNLCEMCAAIEERLKVWSAWSPVCLPNCSPNSFECVRVEREGVKKWNEMSKW